MRLLDLTLEEIQAVVSGYEKESKALKEELYKMAWFMRGSLNFDQVFLLDQQDREIIAKIIEDNLEVTKKSQLPFF
jgi:hypothetical protein